MWIRLFFRYHLANLNSFVINLFSLVIGFSIFLIIISYVSYEQSFDTHINDSERTFRLTTVSKSEGYMGSKYGTMTQALLAPTLEESIDDIDLEEMKKYTYDE